MALAGQESNLHGLPRIQVQTMSDRNPNTTEPAHVTLPLSPVLPPGLRRSKWLLNRQPQPGTAKDSRTEKYQKRWGRIGQKLPPQLNRRHISVISIGGVIGMGLFVGSGTSLATSGPVGTLVAYSLTGSVVWCVVVSIGEMVSFLPNVGGPVGLAGLYVDPALGFALGWNAWYNWTIVLPTEISAAVVLCNDLLPSGAIPSLWKYGMGWVSMLVLFAIIANCLGSKKYGDIEFVFSCFKILLIIFLVITGLVLDAIPTGSGVDRGATGFSNWKHNAFKPYRIPGRSGQFLGIWSSMSQACFSYFGTEVPGIAAGEVQNPTRNIPHAVRRVWIRITLLYISSVFIAGLLVQSDDKRLGATSPGGTSYIFTSPFIIAFENHNLKVLAKIINVAFILASFSAATSMVFTASRFLFFLAECGYAPHFFSLLYTNGKANHSNKRIVVPWVGTLVAAGFALLAYMSATDAYDAFHWLSSMTSAAALLAWIGMLYTYIRWYNGTKFKEAQDPNFRQDNFEHLYKNRSCLQPYAAYYAIVMCILIIVFNGWYIFTRPGPWRIANEPGDKPVLLDAAFGPWVPTFVSSYVPIPLFLLGILGYKLIFRTKMVRLEDMEFKRGFVEEIPEVIPTGRIGKLFATLF